MHTDRYGNPLTSESADARQAYGEGLDRLLEATAGMEAAFQLAVTLDEGFALGYLGLARSRKILGQGADIAGPLQRARDLSAHVTSQERSLIHCMGLLLDGDSQAAWNAIKAHIRDYPRDVMALQPTTGVFGLIGFSGRTDRESEHLNWCESLASQFGEDWWFLAQLGFARVESGAVTRGRSDLERALEGNPDNANAAHYYGHALYELGQHKAGSDWLTQWIRGYDATGPMCCHLYWHLALWALYLGEPQRMQAIRSSHIVPESAVGPPINVLTDGVSLIHRAALAGHVMPADAWQELARYADAHFPATGVSFADVHVALAYASAGDASGLSRLKSARTGTAADLVAVLADAFELFADEDWESVLRLLGDVLPDHARIGGSRAQRDLIEHTAAYALSRMGNADAAERNLAASRPGLLTPHSIEGVMPIPS